MTAMEHQLAKALYNAVCDLPKSAQYGRLRELCEDNARLKYVETLLAQTDSNHPRVAQSVLHSLVEVSVEQVDVGTTLGAWKLVEEIGQGGMGRVFKAQRVDGHFEQTAAVKILHGFPSAKALEYLARERQILATLTHPNIARLYDGGATAGGQPFLVMEFIEGVSIDAHARHEKLDKNAVLKLVLDVCAAISFAHQRLVVHCDIKPTNILVTPSGRPMLLDFGIARLVEAGGDEVTSDAVPATIMLDPANAQTNGQTSVETKARTFTPRYASPEQRAGLPLTTATDVFSLGKVLEELLVNVSKTPVNQTSSGTNAAADIGFELRAMVAKATNDDPVKRYATVNALSADIRRFQAREAVMAVPASGAYSARKFSQRNWPWLMAASIFALMLGVAVLRVAAERDRAQLAEAQALLQRDATQLAQATAVRERDGAQSARLSAERERATAELARDRAAAAEGATAVQRDLAKRSEAAAVAERNHAVTAEAAAKQTSKFLISVFENAGPTAATGDVTAAALLDRAEKQLATDLKSQPDVQARLYTTLGTVQRGMGAYLKAERLHAHAIGLQKQMQPQQQTAAQGVAKSLNGKYVPMVDEKQRRAALELAEKLFTQANDLYVSGKGAAAMTPAREALSLREKYAAADAVPLGESLSQVGHMLVFARKLDEGQILLERGLAIVEKADAQSAATAYALGNLSWQRFRAGDLVAAEALSRRAVALRVAQGGSTEAPYAIKQRQDLARIIEGAGRTEEAEALFRQTLASRTALHGAENMRVAIAQRRLGLSLMKQDRVLEAVPKFIEALDIVVKTEQKESPHYQNMNANLGTAYTQLGDYALAANAFAEAAQYARKLTELGWQDKLISYLNRGAFALTRLQRFDEAAVLLAEALAIGVKTQDEKSMNVITTMAHLADLATASGKFSDARQQLDHIAKLQQATVLPANLSAMLAQARARMALQDGDVNAALQAYEVAEQYWFNFYGKNNSAAWSEKFERAQLLVMRGNAEQKREGLALAQAVIAELTPKLAANASVLHQFNLLLVQR